MKRSFLLIFILAVGANVWAQFPPQAGLTGSTAISAASGEFTGWATHCSVQRGFMDINNPSLGYASLGDSSKAVGASDGDVVSLGDSGVAVLTFATPLYDGPGPDFAVFENGFLNATNPSLAFLELGFVEVSSDGVNYFRFPATSLTQTNTQIGNGDYIDATQLNNLAGKYIGGYGTPFDLSELAGITGLDINNVTHVRIIDVVGSIGANASHDSSGRIVNDPYPTPFPSCGFDLDAVGVLHQQATAVSILPDNITLSVFPNPADEQINISVKGTLPEGMTMRLTSITGSMLMQTQLSQGLTTVPISQLPAGMYYIQICDAKGNKWVEKVTKR